MSSLKLQRVPVQYEHRTGVQEPPLLWKYQPGARVEEAISTTEVGSNGPSRPWGPQGKLKRLTHRPLDTLAFI